jgi:peptide/nickel transport system substrate-binding protein
VITACGATRPVAATGAHTGKAAGPRLLYTRGGSVTVALDDVPTTLNDHTVAGDTTDGRMVASAIWAQVFRVGPGLAPQLDNNVVNSAEVVSLQPQTVVYKINRHAVWSDGVPISAADFSYAWQSQRGGAMDIDGTPDSVTSTLGYRDISSLTGSNGGRTVTVVFRTPFADWASLFDDLLPAHVAERVGWNHGFDQFDPSTLVSGGPFRVVSWTPGQQLVLGRNPKWWASRAALDKVDLVSEASAPMASDLGGGRVQVGYPGSFDQSFMAQVSSSSALESSSGLGTRMLQLEFNVHRTPLDSATTRQGIAHAVDRAGLVSAIGQPENHSVWEDNNHFFANVESTYSDNASGYTEPDPVTAEHLLAQSGLTFDARGTWSLHGKAVSLDLVWASDDPWSAATGPIIAAQLVSAGFDVVENPVPSAQLFASVLPSGAFDLAVVPVDATAYPSAMGAVFSTSPAIIGAGTQKDFSGFDDAKVDSLFTQASQQLAAPSAQAIYRQIDQDLWVSMPTLPLFAEPTMLVTWATVANVTDDPGGIGPLWSLRLWTLLAPEHTRSTTTTTHG